MVNEQFAKKMWISFGIIVASFAIAGGALYFFSGDLTTNANAVVTARAALNQQTAAVQNLASLKQQGEEALQYQAAMDQLVPGQYGLVGFPQWFSAQGGSRGVSATAELQQTPAPPGGTTAGTLGFSYTITGSLDNIDSFLDFMSAKTSAYLIVFNSFNITQGGGSYGATGVGTIFFQ